MKIIALLSWFDENPNMLADLVESLGKAGVDHLVAVDGAYAHFPHEQPWSSPVEYVALQEGCRRWSIDLTLDTPTTATYTEIGKRNRTFKLGHVIAEPYDDWLWVIDADEVVTRAEGVREALEQADRDVGTVWEWETGSSKREERRLFRAHPQGINASKKHSYYRNGYGEVLWGPQEIPAVRLDVEVHHRPLMRSRERTEARLGYYRTVLNDRIEQEVF